MKIFLRILVVLAVLLGLGIFYISRDPATGLYFKEKLKGAGPENPYFEPETPTLSAELLNTMNRRGVDFLVETQNKEGFWANPGITALCARSLLESPFAGEEKTQNSARRALDYLLSLQGEDGSFFIPFSPSTSFRTYTTALSILALKADKQRNHEGAIKKAAAYLSRSQNSSDAENISSGGFGYSSGNNPDLSNTTQALEALKAAGFDENSEVFKRARLFVQRSQDAEGNDQAWAGKSGDSGGFIYSPLKIDENGHPSPYGAMSFAGLSSLLFTGLTPDDEQVQNSLKWISRHFAVSEHPEKGDLGLYFYYYHLSKSLSLAGVNEIKQEENKVALDWRKELAKELYRRQNPKGYWSNSNREYLEGVPELATAYALLALNAMRGHP